MSQDRFVKFMLAAVAALLITNVLLQISRPVIAASQGRRTYRVVDMGQYPTADDHESMLNKLSREGWHLVAVDPHLLYLEK